MTRGGVREELKGHNTEHTKTQHRAGRCIEKWKEAGCLDEHPSQAGRQAGTSPGWPEPQGWPGRGFQKVKKLAVARLAGWEAGCLAGHKIQKIQKK